MSQTTGRNPEYAEQLLLPSWDHYSRWQARVLRYCLDELQYEVAFSHLHNIDLIGHHLWHLGKHRDCCDNDKSFYQAISERTYTQTDSYIGEFLPYLDEGWSILLVSDHGLITEENESPGLGEAENNGIVMVDLGYTVLKYNDQVWQKSL